MMLSFAFKPALASGLAAAAMFAVPASANAALSPGGPVVSSLPAFVSNSVVISVTNFNVAGIFSVDPAGDPLNEVFNLSLAPGARVIGLGWDVTLFADAPSWLSEMVVRFGSTSVPFELELRPGIGDNFPGVRSYSSGGIVDLVGLGFDFTVDANGILRLEFYDSFDDFANDWDGIWRSGNLAIQWSVAGDEPPVIPEPATWAMMIAGFGLVGFAARRRRQAMTTA